MDGSKFNSEPGAIGAMMAVELVADFHRKLQTYAELFPADKELRKLLDRAEGLKAANDAITTDIVETIKSAIDKSSDTGLPAD